MTGIDDTDRDRVIEQLRAHFAAGRLGAQSLNQRVETALGTDDPATLGALLADLPADGYAWSPAAAAHQQVVPHRGPTSRPAPQPAIPAHPGRLAGIVVWLVPTVLVVMVLVAVLSYGLSLSWWVLFAALCWLPQASRWMRQRHATASIPHRFHGSPDSPSSPDSPNAPQPIQDSYRPEEGQDGPPAQWSQPPR